VLPQPDEGLTKAIGSGIPASQVCKLPARDRERVDMFDILAWGFLGMTAGMFALLLFLAWEYRQSQSQ
jgi:hypothetical protein